MIFWSGWRKFASEPIGKKRRWSRYLIFCPESMANRCIGS
jgi:hypothetical protein